MPPFCFGRLGVRGGLCSSLRKGGRLRGDGPDREGERSGHVAGVCGQLLDGIECLLFRQGY